jgi:type I restriction enzyme R subunit
MMSEAKFTYEIPSANVSVIRERDIEEDFISKLVRMKYTFREDIRDRKALEANFREKFDRLNAVTLSDSEFARLLDQITTPDVYKAAETLRTRTKSTSGA